MFSIKEQFSAATKSQLESQLKFFNLVASKAVEGTEKVIALNLSTGKAAVEKTSSAARQLFEARDPKEFFTFGAAQAPGLDSLLDYGRQLFSIASGVQAELVASAKDQMRQATPSPSGSVPALTLAASAPAAADTAAVVDTATATATEAPVAASFAAAAPSPAAPVDAAPVEQAAPEPAAALVVETPPAAPVEAFAAPLAAPKAAAKTEAKSKPATQATPVAEAVATLSAKPAEPAKPAAAVPPAPAPVVLKSVAGTKGKK